MKPLETEIKNSGHDLKQIKRDGRVALYERTASGDPRGYEVIVILNRKEQTVFGNLVRAHEAYPGNEQWGSHGWTYPPKGLESAEKRFASLLPKYGANAIGGAIPDVLEPSEGEDSGEEGHGR